MKCSVVIPTYNEAKQIATCLEAIRNNTEQPEEVIVVDGHSDDETRTMAERSGATVCLNDARHAAGGRNVGISRASGDIIVFTDADCVPRKDWISRIRKAFREDPALGGIGGRMVALAPQNEIEAFWGRVFLDEIMCFPAEASFIEHPTYRGSFLTANCAYRREVLRALGGFDEWFANNAEDMDLFWRAIGHGAKLHYLPDVIVDHPFSASMDAMIKKNFRNGVSSSKLQKRHGSCLRIDRRLYALLGRNLVGVVTRKKEATLYCIQLTAHLAGKYYGSLRAGVINL